MARRAGGGERERFWREALRRQRRSGLTIREFCRGEELAEPSFYWWRRELADRGRSSTPRRVAASSPRRPRARGRGAAGKRPTSVARFVPVAVAPPSAAAAYELLLPGGVRVLVHGSAGEQRLVDVLAALQQSVTEQPSC